MPNIEKVKFREVNLDDPFFDTLKESYAEFEDWFTRKAEADAYILRNGADGLQAFLYLKLEEGPITDISPPLNVQRCIKVGTFKIIAHGTRLGERFVKKIFDHALSSHVRHAYVTVFPEHVPLIRILERYGFTQYGTKDTENGQELVFLKDFNTLRADALLDYPVVNAVDTSKWLLSIYPPFHTRLFPDSILRNEDARIVDDISETNSISKVYIAYMDGMTAISPGDSIVVYRTAEVQGRAWFTSVATSLCVVQDVRQRSVFVNQDAFVEYCKKNSVFSEAELVDLYSRQVRNPMVVIRMTYNVAFRRRPTMQRLVEDVGLAREAYWGFRALDDNAFRRIIELGGVDEGTVIHQA